MPVNGRRQRRILHTSDIHLTTVGDEASQSLKALVDVAIEARADLVLIAGDLFDHNRVDDKLVDFTVEQFQRLPGSVAILPGNHDCFAHDSVFSRSHLWENSPNVRVFKQPDGEAINLPDHDMVVWGKSINSYDYDVRPLEGIPQSQRNGCWHIAVAHGYYVSSLPPFYPSLHITHEEIVTSGQDYIALGHIPTFGKVCDEPVKAYYSGSPWYSNTVAIVDLNEKTGVQVSCHFLK
ncbi:MAG: DNA repair exonuclease [Chloroflexi bacterium]|nr:DNA repair exonuclease [Chloroflexota bacterium]